MKGATEGRKAEARLDGTSGRSVRVRYNQARTAKKGKRPPGCYHSPLGGTCCQWGGDAKEDLTDAGEGTFAGSRDFQEPQGSVRAGVEVPKHVQGTAAFNAREGFFFL